MSEPPIDPPVEEEIIDGWATAPVSGDRLDVNENSFIAGDPAGARIEIRSTGFHAFNGVGTETAHIDGAEGVFVGGEFRTSDTLPGQVILADDAYINSSTGVAHPGIRVEPLDTSDMVRPPGIGPGDLGLYVDGGSDTSGRRSYMRASPTESLMRTIREDGTTGGAIQTSPTASFMRTFREDGTAGGEIAALPTESFMHTSREDGTTGGAIQTSPTSSLMRTYSGNSSEAGWVRVRPQDAELAYVAPNNTYFSRIKADASEAFLYTRAGGTNRYLTVDADGIWVKTGAKSYNLEQTAQDSGWNALTLDAGITGAGNPAWRNKGGVIYMRGQVTRTWTGDGTWDPVATGLPAEVRPLTRVHILSPSVSVNQLVFRVGTDGTLEARKTNGTGPATIGGELSGIIYPTG